MRLQARLALAVAAAASVAIFVMATAFWVVAAREQRDSVDQSLIEVVEQPRRLAEEVIQAQGDRRPVRPGRGFGDIFDEAAAADDRLFARIRFTRNDGRVVVDEGLPFVEAEDKPRIITVTVDGERFRMAVAEVGDQRGGGTLQVARNVEDVERSLSQLRRQILLGSLLGIALAALLGALVARRLTKPISEVAAAAQQMAVRQDLPHRIETDRTDEVGDLADSFNRMVSALEVSREQQQRLVGDASHELRTPLTSLRLKIDLLDSTPDLPAAQRQELLSGAALELERLSELVTELVDLATDPTAGDEIPLSVDLGSLARDVAENVRRSSGRDIEVVTDETIAVVRERGVRRAISNLLDNAVKYSPPASPIVLEQRTGHLEVRDSGPGLPDDALDAVFDRFYRAPSARTQPGNGIGLAIVKRVAELHGGEVWARNAPTGGAVVGFSVAVPAHPAPEQAE